MSNFSLPMGTRKGFFVEKKSHILHITGNIDAISKAVNNTHPSHLAVLALALVKSYEK